jgi:soluble lytic murein transglycosylase
VLGVANRVPPSIAEEPGSPTTTPAGEDYLGDIWGPEDIAARDALSSGEQWLRAVELADAGFGDLADDEFRALIDANRHQPWLIFRLVQEIEKLGRPWVSAPAAAVIAGSKEISVLLKLAYPLAYFEIVSDEASADGFSPYLLLALVRQESLYDPSAVSPAEAMGLTQVIPSTADGIAEQLGVEGFRYTDLLRPRVSLRFGAHYLGSQIEGFGGVTAVALAAYNGGPANAGRWWEAAGGDPDLFLETIEYPETRAYVELVMENYAKYLYTYGEVFTPSLP